MEEGIYESLCRGYGLEQSVYLSPFDIKCQIKGPNMKFYVSTAHAIADVARSRPKLKDRTCLTHS